MIKCPYCEVRFYSIKSQKRHIKFIHGKDVVCVLCGKNLFDYSLVEHHIEYGQYLGLKKIGKIIQVNTLHEWEQRIGEGYQTISSPDITVTLCRSCHIKEHLPLIRKF